MESIDTHRIGEARDIGQIAKHLVARQKWPEAFETNGADDRPDDNGKANGQNGEEGEGLHAAAR